MSKKKTKKSYTQQVPLTSISRNEKGVLMGVVKATPNMVVGRNVAIMNANSQEIASLGKVILNETDNAYIDIENIKAILHARPSVKTNSRRSARRLSSLPGISRRVQHRDAEDVVKKMVERMVMGSSSTRILKNIPEYTVVRNKMPGYAMKIRIKGKASDITKDFVVIPIDG